MMIADKYENPSIIKYEILKMNPKHSDVEVAYWAFKMIKLYNFQQNPAQPKKVLDYYSLPDQKRKQMNFQSSKFSAFWNDEDVKKYFNKVDKIRGKNDVNLNFLKWIRTILKDDLQKVSVINSSIGTYPKYESAKPKVVEKARVDWDD